MNGIRIGQSVLLEIQNEFLQTIVSCVEIDRVYLEYFKKDKEKFSLVGEGDILCASVKTKNGIKKMNSMVIEFIEDKIVIENAPLIEDIQNREDVRAHVEIKLFIQANNTLYKAKTLDISAGGIKFELANHTHSLDNNDEIRIRISDLNFDKEIMLNAKIYRTISEKVYVAQFENNDKNALKAIASFCMRNID